MIIYLSSRVVYVSANVQPTNFRADGFRKIGVGKSRGQIRVPRLDPRADPGVSRAALRSTWLRRRDDADGGRRERDHGRSDLQAFRQQVRPVLQGGSACGSIGPDTYG